MLLSFDKEHILIWIGKQYTTKKSEERTMVSSSSVSGVSKDDSTDSEVFVI